MISNTTATIIVSDVTHVKYSGVIYVDENISDTHIDFGILN